MSEQPNLIDLNIFIQELGSKTVEILLLRQQVQELQKRINELNKQPSE